MASGAPDWTRQVDISQQSLASITIRPFYTEDVQTPMTDLVGAGASSTLKTIAGQGETVYGHVFWHPGVTGYEDSYVKVYTDGTLVYAVQPNNAYRDNDLVWTDAKLFVARYDEFLFYYQIGIRAGIQFESQLEIVVTNNGPGAISFDGDLRYRLVP